MSDPDCGPVNELRRLRHTTDRAAQAGSRHLRSPPYLGDFACGQQAGEDHSGDQGELAANSSRTPVTCTECVPKPGFRRGTQRLAHVVRGELACQPLAYLADDQVLARAHAQQV